VASSTLTVLLWSVQSTSVALQAWRSAQVMLHIFIEHSSSCLPPGVHQRAFLPLMACSLLLQVVALALWS